MGIFVTWCEQNHLQLNVTKTKELVVDLRRVRTLMFPSRGAAWTLWRITDTWEFS